MAGIATVHAGRMDAHPIDRRVDRWRDDRRRQIADIERAQIDLDRTKDKIGQALAEEMRVTSAIIAHR